MSIYDSVKACIKTSQGVSNVFICPRGVRQGCSLSPILFCLFINELYDMFCSNDIRGIQMFPDITEIFMLMFDDDVALIADTIVGLQRQLNILSEFSLVNKIDVNIAKTNIVVFKRGGRLAASERWTYRNEPLTVVNSFSYVGVNFTNRLCMYKMAEHVSSKAKRVLFHVFQTFDYSLCLPYNTYFKIFDTKIMPILMYGCELWGNSIMKCIENIHISACKRFLKVYKNACNDSVLGDLGRFPMYIVSQKRVIKYWLRIVSLPDERYVKKCYNMMKYYDACGHSNWVTSVRTNLYSNGFGYIWEMQDVQNKLLLFFENV